MIGSPACWLVSRYSPWRAEKPNSLTETGWFHRGPRSADGVVNVVALRKSAICIFEAGLAAADPGDAVRRELRGLKAELGGFDRIFVVGAGKATAAMAHAVERVLGARITAGLINVKDGHTAALAHIRQNECGHPIPDERGVSGAARIAEIARQANRRDLVLALISGGASALLPLPASPVTLAEKQETTRLLLECGANIHEINAVRKHISLIKGGQLSRLASPATVISLLLSDVIGDDLDVIGSGPTAPDHSTFASARAVLRKYQLLERVPAAVRSRIEKGVRKAIPENPQPGNAVFRRTRNIVVGSNRQALNAAAREARRLGFRTLILASGVQGETRDVARMHAAMAREIRESGLPVAAPACIITGGETTVTLRGSGKGGRNQEFVLAAAMDIAGLPRTVVLSCGTDGTDGPTDAAGAIADGGTVGRGQRAAEYLDGNNAYPYFEALGDLVITGPTNTNVMDIHVVLVG